MNKVITNKISDVSTAKIFNQLSKSADVIVITVAFFSDPAIVNKLIESGKSITLVVSLRPPTNYYSLKDILHNRNVDILFLGDDFHSKIYGFYNSEKVIDSAILGSSNFTNGGLHNNFETNLITKDKDILKQIDSNINEIINLSAKLQPDILNQYKKRYDQFKKAQAKDHNPIRTNNEHTGFKVSKNASQYLKFWNVVDQVKGFVGDISAEEYPLTPKYLVIDHFWHWVVIICDKKKLDKFSSKKTNKKKLIRTLFSEYCKWGKLEKTGYTERMGETSKEIIDILNPSNIKKLNKRNALFVYRSLHASHMPSQRFGADLGFIQNNKMEQIRKSFIHLLDDTLPIDLRIHNLTHKKSTYKLEQFGSSCIQELIGWANPEVMPIRNNKADKAVKLLGYEY
ncbi:phospholipase D family protein [Pseudoalteromonas rhizosphaerae]|uniref:Phospholipase D family protein n=1 Tax=Pseudoalteromonas rhizosphaerae TaxID=2518973 RepID=A0ABW8L2N1_9GAMM